MIRTFTIAAVAALAITACGGGGSDTPVASDPQTSGPDQQIDFEALAAALTVYRIGLAAAYTGEALGRSAAEGIYECSGGGTFQIINTNSGSDTEVKNCSIKAAPRFTINGRQSAGLEVGNFGAITSVGPILGLQSAYVFRSGDLSGSAVEISAGYAVRSSLINQDLRIGSTSAYQITNMSYEGEQTGTSDAPEVAATADAAFSAFDRLFTMNSRRPLRWNSLAGVVDGAFELVTRGTMQSSLVYYEFNSSGDITAQLVGTGVVRSTRWSDPQLQSALQMVIN